MKLYEMLIAIGIFVIVCMCFLESYTIVQKNENTSKKLCFEVTKILEYDDSFRTFIRGINIPYWQNAEKRIEKDISLIKEYAIGKGINIVSVDYVLNKEMKVQGIRILWRYEDKEYETIESIGSAVIIKA